MRYAIRDYAWAVLELVPGLPDQDDRQRLVEQRALGALRSVRWGRALVAGPVLACMLAGQQAVAQTATVDAPHTAVSYAGWINQVKSNYDKYVNDFLTRNAETGRFISNMFVAYKSYKMMNSMAQRIRYGNIDFLVEMALPKLDYLTNEKPTAKGESVSRRTQISFVSGPQQAQENLQWLMRYGHRKLRSQLQQSPTGFRNIGSQLMEKIRTSLANPEGDVSFMTIGSDADGKTVVNMRSPEVWVQLANADATAAWIFSQHRVGIGSDYHDAYDAQRYVDQREQHRQNAALTRAYNRLIELQNIAAASGESLYRNSAYQDALRDYYALANAANQGSKTTVRRPTASQRLAVVEENARALQEAIGGLDVMLSAVNERNRAAGENLNQIGQMYAGSQVPSNASLTDFISKDPGANNKAMMGVALKQLLMLQSVNQNMAELLKVMAARELKDNKQDLEKVGNQKVDALTESEIDSGEMAEDADNAYRTAQQEAVEGALNEVANSRVVVPLIDSAAKPDKNGAPAILGVGITPVGGDPKKAEVEAKKIFDKKVQAATTKTLSSFQDELQADLTSMKGSKGFFMQTIMVFVGAVKKLLGLTFDLTSEAAAWEAAGKSLKTVTIGGLDGGAMGADDLKQIDLDAYLQPQGAIPAIDASKYDILFTKPM